MILEAREVDFSKVSRGKPPRFGDPVQVPYVEDEDIVFESCLPDGRSISYVLVQRGQQPVFDVYRINPDAKTWKSADGKLIVEDFDESPDFPMRRVDVISPKRGGRCLNLRQQAEQESKYFCFSVRP